MEKKITFERKSADIIRSVVAPLIKARANLRGDSGTALANALASVSLTSSVIPTSLPDDALLRSTTINGLLDAILLDHMILYTDAFTIEDEFSRLYRIFDDHVGTLLMNIETLSTEAESIMRKKELGISFAKSFHRTPVSEGTTNGFYGVAINSAARCYRLASIATNHASATSTSIKSILLSEEASIIMEGAPQKAFSTVALDPYYIIVNSDNEPYNKEYYSGDFSRELGAIVSIVVRFSNVVPISRVRVQPFSTSPVEVLGIYAPKTPGATWEGDVMDLLHGRITQTSREIEMTFPRTHTSEIHIVMRQNKFITVPETIYVGGLSLLDYITYAVRAMEYTLPSGFSTREPSSQVSEFLNEVRSKLAVPTVPVKAGSRLYILGISSIIAEDASYQVYGMHESVSELVDTTPLRAAMLFDNNTSLTDEDFTTLGYINYNGVSYAISPLGTGKIVRDAIIVPYQDEEENYVFPLHFFLDPREQLTIRYGGRSVTIDPEELAAYCYADRHNSVLVIPREVLDGAVEVINGVPMLFTYTTPDFTPRGTVYNPEILDIRAIAGNVTLDESCKPEVHEHPIFVKRNIAGNSFIMIEDENYTEAIHNGENVYIIHDTKGISGEPFFRIGSTLYVPESSVVGPFSGCYQGIIGEPVTLTKIAEDGAYGVYSGETYYPYAKGTLSVLVNGIPSQVTEYANDTRGSILSDNKRKVFTTRIELLRVSREGIDSVRATYVPLVSSNDTVSCIRSHNMHETFSLDKATVITLSSPSFADPAIIMQVGREFGLTEAGVFFLKRDFSVTYEPVVVTVNGVKCRNTTDYTGSGKQPEPLLTVPSFHVDLTSPSKLIFDREIHGTVRVDYYTIPTKLSGGFMFYHTNPQRESESPTLRWYDVLVDTC